MFVDHIDVKDWLDLPLLIDLCTQLRELFWCDVKRGRHGAPSRLGEVDFASAWAPGRAMPLEQAHVEEQ